MSATPRPRTQFTPERPAFYTADEMENLPSPPAIVEGMLFAGRTSVAVAESGAGKSFITLSMLAAVSQGREWMGFQTVHGSVVSVSFEGDDTPTRITALKAQVGPIPNFYCIRMESPLSPVIDRSGKGLPSEGEEELTDRLAILAEEIRQKRGLPIVAVCIDTVRASMSGSEDSSDVVSAYLQAVRRIVRNTCPGAALDLIHHTGWQSGENPRVRERGSSAFRGNVDAVRFYQVEDKQDPSAVRITVSCPKARDAGPFKPFSLIRRAVSFSKDGKLMSSCVIEADPMTPAQRIGEREVNRAADDTIARANLRAGILSLIRDNDGITSGPQIREYLVANRDKVTHELASLLNEGLIVRPKQRAPFRLTSEGLKHAGPGSTQKAAPGSTQQAGPGSTQSPRSPRKKAL